MFANNHVAQPTLWLRDVARPRCRRLLVIQPNARLFPETMVECSKPYIPNDGVNNTSPQTLSLHSLSPSTGAEMYDSWLSRTRLKSDPRDVDLAKYSNGHIAIFAPAFQIKSTSILLVRILHRFRSRSSSHACSSNAQPSLRKISKVSHPSLGIPFVRMHAWRYARAFRSTCATTLELDSQGGHPHLSPRSRFGTIT